MPVSIYSYSAVTTVNANSNATINVSVPGPGMVAVALMGGGNISHNAPKYNGASGTPMTLVVGKDDTQDETYMYMYVNPATGTIPFYFDEFGGQVYRAMIVLLGGVNLSNPVAGSMSWNANPTDFVDFTINHAYAVGQLGLACGANAYTNTGFVNGTITLLGTSANSFHGYVSAEADGTTRATLSANSSNRYCAVGAIFNPAVGIGSQSIWWW